MKKTLTISISGIVFNIEEDAFDKLHRYLEAIKSHFRGFSGKEEVISDVESRVAEIFQNRLSSSKEVITIDDIDEVISILGQPDDFAMDDEGSAGESQTYYNGMPKRLYRDTERKMIGGVCSGLGAYFNIDPSWVRLIFLFAVLVLGSGFLLYFVLWLVIPEARTTAEKLEMRGEAVNISNIEKALGDEVHEIKTKFNDFTKKAKSQYRKQREEFSTQHSERVRRGIGGVGRILLRILLIFVGFLVLLVGLSLTVAYLSILLRFPVIAVLDDAGIHSFPLYAMVDHIFETDLDIRTFATGLMIVTGIPLLMMLWGGIRLIFNLPRARYISGAAGFIWICALIITLIFGIKVGNSFHHPAEFTRESGIQISKGDTIHVFANRSLPENFEREWSGVFYFPELRMVVANDNNILYGIPLLKFKPSKDTLARINIFTSSRGTFTRQAMENAEKINYEWQQKNDSLFLSDSFVLPEDEKWRKQEARVEVQLPVGTTVSIDKPVYPLMGYHRYVSRHEKIGTLYMMSNEGLVKREP